MFITEELQTETMSLDEYLIRDRDSSFILRVKGDSMIDAGIYEGDMLIVERGRTPRLGDIVIARVDGEFAMKHYRGSSSGELVIDAVVMAVVRKLYK